MRRSGGQCVQFGKLALCILFLSMGLPRFISWRVTLRQLLIPTFLARGSSTAYGRGGKRVRGIEVLEKQKTPKQSETIQCYSQVCAFLCTINSDVKQEKRDSSPETLAQPRAALQCFPPQGSTLPDRCLRLLLPGPSPRLPLTACRPIQARVL